jgi:RNA polymerase sigma-70 factor, ECF subfamily
VSTAPALLEAARAGDEDAFRRLVEPHRRELHAHCYRMLGSFQDAEDALQDTLLRAWRALPRFEARSSVRSWLYRIATNASLDVIGRRPKRVLPIDYGPAGDPHAGPPADAPVEAVWVDPYPDEGVEGGFAAPEARYEQRESVELAFIAVLQHLPARQRAVLILREVLGFSAQEVAETLETTVASVNSALQRARAAAETRLPAQSQQATLRTLDDDSVRELVESFVDAWERGDVEAIVALLAEDATIAMPPLPTWYSGRDAVADFLATYPLSGALRWRAVPTHANGQPAVAKYTWEEEAGAYLPFALDVLALDGPRIAGITAFVPRESAFRDPLVLRMFERFGLPARL